MEAARPSSGGHGRQRGEDLTDPPFPGCGQCLDERGEVREVVIDGALGGAELGAQVLDRHVLVPGGGENPERRVEIGLPIQPPT
jgi:hypothetical protein